MMPTCCPRPVFVCDTVVVRWLHSLTWVGVLWAVHRCLPYVHGSNNDDCCSVSSESLGCTDTAAPPFAAVSAHAVVHTHRPHTHFRDWGKHACVFACLLACLLVYGGALCVVQLTCDSCVTCKAQAGLGGRDVLTLNGPGLAQSSDCQIRLVWCSPGRLHMAAMPSSAFAYLCVTCPSIPCVCLLPHACVLALWRWRRGRNRQTQDVLSWHTACSLLRAVTWHFLRSVSASMVTAHVD